MRSIPFGCPILGDEERNAVMEVLRGHVLTHGPRVKEFEEVFAKFTGANYAVATASCTAALHLSYSYVDLGPGDEVIVPAETHVAAAHAVELFGAKPVFVDSEKLTGNVDVEEVETVITDRTKALSIVHYLGMPVDMNRVGAIAKKYGLFVVEDCALALGAYFNGVHCGLQGDVGCFSFYPVKHITTGEGGMVITKHKNVAEKVAKQRAFGIDQNVVSKRKIPGMYDVEMQGSNYRLNEIAAAIGIEQMKRVGDFLRKRRENFELLGERLRSIDEVELLQTSHGEFQSSYYCLPMILKEPLHTKRTEIMELLVQNGIGMSIYYPKPVPHMAYYKSKYDYRDNSFPVAARLSSNSIALPVGPHVQAEDMLYVVDKIKDAIARVKR